MCNWRLTAGIMSRIALFRALCVKGGTHPKFHELGNERDPIIGTQDGTYDMTIPKRPIRRKIKGLPAFTTVKGGAYFFLPGLRALRYLTTLADGRQSQT